jgi:diguanylate cyclase (GGDEF)-like protein
MLLELANAMAIEENPDYQLHSEVSRLQDEVQRLEQENHDLRIALSNTAEHGDFIEAQLYKTNTKLQAEVVERRRAELTLKSLVSVMSQQRDDLEIILETLMDHGDVLDAQWQQKVSQANLLATSDGLTQIANRRRFDEYLEEQWLRMARGQAPLSILLCDIDFFKQYNDAYGHPAGDACLKQVVQALSSAIYRSPDLLARYGGEEFAAILPQTDREQALKVAQRMQAAIAYLQIPHSGSTINPYVTVSIGIASVIPSEQRSASVLLNEADRQLYYAKHQGRNQIVHNDLELPEEPFSL